MQEQYTRFGNLLLQFCLFVLGAYCSSVVVGGEKKFHVGPQHSAVLGAVAFLILVASFLNSAWPVLLIVSFVSGAQNALATDTTDSR